jgi:hypothetical protein
MENRIASIKTGPGENDIVCIENLLMKLAMAATVIEDMERYIEMTEQFDGVRPDDTEAPDSWALIGMRSAIGEVAHALKCGGWGFQTAHLH